MVSTLLARHISVPGTTPERDRFNDGNVRAVAVPHDRRGLRLKQAGDPLGHAVVSFLRPLRLG
jgi:hypothetical protein